VRSAPPPVTRCLGLLLAAACVAHAVETCRFDTPTDLREWLTKGPVGLDPGRRHGNAGSAMRVEPGASALWKLRDSDGSGRVSLWVFDDCAKAANPKAYRTGPRWGVALASGRVLVVGALYARYLAGDTTYTASDTDRKIWFASLQYLGIRRQPRWRKWTFDFDAEKGMTLLLDGKPVKRFDWNKTKATGFAGVAIFGDQPGRDNPHTIWVDDVEVELGGPMKARPTPPPPPPPVVPDRDPALEGPPVKWRDGMVEKHPRLLLTAERIPKLKAFFASPEAKPWRDQMLAYLPVCSAPAKPAFLRNGTDGQRQGLWRMPTVALHYLLTGEKASFEKAVGFLKFLLALPDWETGSERNSGMSAANIMIGAALAFDWLYNDLDPAFRERFRKKLWWHARAMYHGGHLRKNPGTHYWQNDPQNNHRWHRDAGLALAVLAAFSGAPDEQWLLARTHEELDFVARWLPADGTSHESPTYLVFGGPHLVLTCQASDECLGTSYLDQPFFRNVGLFRLSTLAPGMHDSLHYGDSGGVGGYNNFLLKAAAHHRQADVMDGLRRFRQAEPRAMEFGWWSILWDDPTLAGGKLDRLPAATFWPDLGLATIRESWRDDAVAAMFKCGPLGGYRLNEYRNANDFRYVNVAHDDPDANSFVLLAGGEYLAETDRYSTAKRSANHNTILVNGMGQMVKGRAEPQGWTQPGRGDMTQMARVTAWKRDGDVVIVEGEAAGAYIAYTDRRTKKTRPALDRFRRTFIWVKGGYVLVLDDIRAPEPVDVTWLVQGAKLEAVDAAQGRYRLSKGKARCDFQLVADAPFKAEIGTSTADHRGKPLGWRQLRAAVKTAAVRFASVYDPWGHGDLSLTLEAAGRDKATVTVRSGKFTDTWEWTAATARFEASTLRGTRPFGSAQGRPGGFDVAIVRRRHWPQLRRAPRAVSATPHVPWMAPGRHRRSRLVRRQRLNDGVPARRMAADGRSSLARLARGAQ